MSFILNKNGFKRDGPVVFVVIDGCGEAPAGKGNGVELADPKYYKGLIESAKAKHLHTLIKAHGPAVGLPSNSDMGNSEVGHNALGCGQIYSQGAKLVNESLETGEFFATEKWASTVGAAATDIIASASPPIGKQMDSTTKMITAHGVFPYLTQGTKMESFWDAWLSSLPPLLELDQGKSMHYSIITSITMDNTIWRVCGPQSVFAAKIVQFFWNMGSPMSEVDRLNDVGALINPRDIGSWIQTSAMGGMDGGWVFPAEIPLTLAVEAADSTKTDSDATQMFASWAASRGILLCTYLSRDMGKSPPQQTEFRMYLPGSDFNSQLAVALDAMSTFQFPGFPDNPISILAGADLAEPMMLSIVTCAKGFVSLGLVIPHVPMDVVTDLIQNCGGKVSVIQKFMDASGCKAPAAIELQCLMKGYGYGVYKEGFDMLFHWDIGTETRE